MGTFKYKFLKHKFGLLTEIVKDFIDISLISVSRVPDSFLKGQLILDGYHAPFRFDRNQNGGGLLLYHRGNTPVNVCAVAFLLPEAFNWKLFFIRKDG